MEDLLQIHQGALEVSCIHEEVVEVNHTAAPGNTRQSSLLQALKGSWPIAEPEWEPPVLVAGRWFYPPVLGWGHVQVIQQAP